MTNSWKQFDLDIGPFVEKAKGRMQSFVTEFVFDLAEEIVQTTPVDTGFAQSSWFSTLNDDEGVHASTATGNDGKKASFPDAGATLARLSATLSQALPGDIIHLKNNCRYINVLEDGFGSRAGRFFVKSALAQSEAIAHKVIARITQ